MKIILKNILLAIIIFLVVIIALFLLNGYDVSLEYILAFFNKSEKLAEVTSLVSRNSFYIALIFIGSIIAILVFTYIKFDKVYKYSKSFFVYFTYSIKYICKDTLNCKLLIVLMLPIVVIIYYAFNMSPTPDEAYTYFWFINKPFYNCMIFYPFPNNHVFYSLCAHFANFIPIFSKIFLMRLPAILAFIFASSISFSFIKKHYSEKVALCIVALFSVVSMQLSFAMQARGYAFVSLFLIICLFAAYNIISKQNNRNDWTIFIISSILGLYTIPAFLYPYLTVNFLIFIFKPKEIKKQIYYNIIACIAVFILYAPIMIVSGTDVLFSNKFVMSISRLEVLQQLPALYNSVISELFNINSYLIPIFFIIILGSFVFSYISKNKKLAITFLVFILSPIVLLLLHSVMPYTRVFIYYAFVTIFLVCITWKIYVDKLLFKIMIPLLLVIQVICIINQINMLNHYEVIREYIGHTYQPILKDRDKTFYYVSGDLDFMFEISTRNMNNQMTVDEFIPSLDADTVSDFNYIIIEKDRDETKNMSIYMSNKKMNIYKIEH